MTEKQPWDEKIAARAYCAYGVDLIRTGGALVHTTPSAVYRASQLFQRFQQSTTTNYRSRYLTTEEMARGTGAAAGKAEYMIPEHVDAEGTGSGVVPVIDLRAPMDYSLKHINTHHDVTYLAAACLLIAVKMEDSGIRIRPIVETYTLLARRRCGMFGDGALKPPQSHYHDFKACVVAAEEIVLEELGFQTFVESPFKYATLFMNMLVQGDGQGPSGTTPPELGEWLSRAVSFLNDVPRCNRMALFSAAEVAVYAIRHTMPEAVAAQLPSNWGTAFGVRPTRWKEMEDAYNGYLGSVKVSSKDEIEQLCAERLPPLLYQKQSEKENSAVPQVEEGEIEKEDTGAPAKTENRILSALEATVNQAPSPSPTDSGKAAADDAAASAAPSPRSSTESSVSPARTKKEEGDDDDDTVDLLELRKRRRKEEKRRAKKERKERKERKAAAQRKQD